VDSGTDSSRGRFSIAPRGLIELEPYIAKEYPEEIKKCHRCRKLLLSVSLKLLICGVAKLTCRAKRARLAIVGNGVWVQVCELTPGDIHFHSYCLSGMKRATCPSCSVSYDQVKPVYIGEKAVPRAEDDFVGRSKKRRRQTNGAEDEEEDEDEASDAESEEGQVQEGEQSQSQDQNGTRMTQAGAGPVSKAWATAQPYCMSSHAEPMGRLGTKQEGPHKRHPGNSARQRLAAPPVTTT
jgi:hypothetical protein